MTRRARRDVLDERRQSVYLHIDMIEELRAEAARLERSMSWLVQHAWRITRDEIRAEKLDDDDDDEG